MRKVYLDRTGTDNCISLFVSDREVIPAGTTIYYMDIEDENEEYKKCADYGIHFIFEDNIPTVPFYTVPQVDILARDGEGGFIGTVGQVSDLDSDAPICYINRDQECFLIAKNGREFLNIMDSWKNHLLPYDDIIFYNSKSEAERELEFIGGLKWS